jgi:hypothetical protein
VDVGVVTSSAPPRPFPPPEDDRLARNGPLRTDVGATDSFGLVGAGSRTCGQATEGHSGALLDSLHVIVFVIAVVDVVKRRCFPTSGDLRTYTQSRRPWMSSQNLRRIGRASQSNCTLSSFMYSSIALLSLIVTKEGKTDDWGKITTVCRNGVR